MWVCVCLCICMQPDDAGRHCYWWCSLQSACPMAEQRCCIAVQSLFNLVIFSKCVCNNKSGCSKAFFTGLTWVNHYAKLFSFSSLGVNKCCTVLFRRLHESSTKVNNIQPTANKLNKLTKLTLSSLRRREQWTLFFCTCALVQGTGLCGTFQSIAPSSGSCSRHCVALCWLANWWLVAS